MFSFNMQIKRTLNELEMLICVQKATLLKNYFIFFLFVIVYCVLKRFSQYESHSKLFTATSHLIALNRLIGRGDIMTPNLTSLLNESLGGTGKLYESP